MRPLEDTIRTIPGYPKPGILFRDITTLLGDPQAFMRAVDALVQPYVGASLTCVAGIEARGFVLGGVVAYRLALGFIPVRKKGKLPWKTLTETYALEYGTDTIEIHEDAVKPGDKVLLIDDLLATGGTAAAAIKLIEGAGATVAACAFVIDLPELGGRTRLEALGKPVHSLVKFDGE